MVEDGGVVKGGSLGKDVLHAELVPLVKCDNPSALEVHGVEYLLPGQVLLAGIQGQQVKDTSTQWMET